MWGPVIRIRKRKGINEYRNPSFVLVIRMGATAGVVTVTELNDTVTSFEGISEHTQ
jgi:hypothetical protein